MYYNFFTLKKNVFNVILPAKIALEIQITVKAVYLIKFYI